MNASEIFKRITRQRATHLKPSFIIIGAQKAATSSLFKILGSHPDIRAPRTKEMSHFSSDDRYHQDMIHYYSRFPFQSLWRNHITFEASPQYLFQAEKVAPRLKFHLPAVICVAVLRDPVLRAYSAWNMFRHFKDHHKLSHLYDPRTFEQAVADELAGRKDPLGKDYLARGNYAEQLTHYQVHFPKDQLLVLSYLDLKKDPDRFIQDLCKHLHLAPMPQQTYAHVRENERPYHERLGPGLAKELYHFFTPSLEKLREVLGYDLDILEDNA